VFDATSNNVWHYQTLSRGAATSFIELPFFANVQVRISVFPGSLATPFFNSTANTNSVSLTLTGLTQNSYQLVTATGTFAGTSFTLNQFDVTPNPNDVPGTIEQEFINLVQPAGSLGSGNGVPLNAFDLIVSSPNGTAFFCDRVLQFTTVGDSKTVFTHTNGGTEQLSVVLPNTACCGATSLGSVTLNSNAFANNNCGKRVTLITGRPYQVTIPSCTTNLTPSGGTCTFNNNTAPVFGIGDLAFTGNSFFETPNNVNQLQTITFDIQSCSCVPSVPVVTSCSASACDILNAISGSSVAGSVSGLAGSLNTVISKLTHINATLFNVKNLDNSIKNLVKKRC